MIVTLGLTALPTKSYYLLCKIRIPTLDQAGEPPDLPSARLGDQCAWAARVDCFHGKYVRLARREL
jgi:hypothetical protein